jgi:protein gp37
MGVNTAIEWAHHTFNPWLGCTPISAGCDLCYAEGWAKRTGQAELWHGERRRTTASYWQQPLKWDRQAAAAGKRRRVFPSLCDPFDNQVPTRWRDDFWHLIDQTPHLDWLLLTKRPQNIPKMLPDPRAAVRAWGNGWRNVWLGVTAEDQEHYSERYGHLSSVAARVRFISYEPALDWLRIDWVPSPRVFKPDWIICGGESGPGARPINPAWVRMVRDHCRQFGIAFFFKQWGEWAPCSYGEPHSDNAAIERNLGGCWMLRVGKKHAGRDFDGRSHDEFPKVA